MIGRNFLNPSTLKKGIQRYKVGPHRKILFTMHGKEDILAPAWQETNQDWEGKRGLGDSARAGGRG